MPKINPRVDIAFKKIFGVEENKDLLISLINAIVSAEDQIQEITLLNPYNPQNFREDKLSILDIKAKGVHGQRFNIEIQVNDEADYDKRALYYWAKLYGEQLQSGGEYASLKKAIGIHILNFTSIPENRNYHNTFYITERETGQRYFDDLELHTIELKKFTDAPPTEFADLAPKIQTSLDMWAAFLIRHDLMRKDVTDPIFLKAFHVIDHLNFTEEERTAYEDHLKWLRAEASALKKAEAKAREEGREEGLGIGLEMGREVGRTEERVVMARRLLAKGYPLDLVCEATTLPLEEVQKITTAS